MEKVLKACASIALTLYLLVGTAPLLAQPSKQYLDTDPSRVQNLLNVRVRKQRYKPIAGRRRRSCIQCFCS
jgi:hypothetical protein